MTWEKTRLKSQDPWDLSRDLECTWYRCQNSHHLAIGCLTLCAPANHGCWARGFKCGEVDNNRIAWEEPLDPSAKVLIFLTFPS